jgi:hypothetical protein
MMSNFMDEIISICKVPNKKQPRRQSPQARKPARSKKQKMVEQFVPPKMQGTPLEDLILKGGGGTSNMMLGLGGPEIDSEIDMFCSVPGVDDDESLINYSIEEDDFEPVRKPKMSPLQEARQHLEHLVKCFGGRIRWG